MDVNDHWEYTVTCGICIGFELLKGFLARLMSMSRVFEVFWLWFEGGEARLFANHEYLQQKLPRKSGNNKHNRNCNAVSSFFSKLLVRSTEIART